MKDSPIQILGFEITKDKFPHLYPIAENNPEGLASQRRAWAHTHGDNDFQGAAILLEYDLQHEFLTAHVEVE